MLFNEGFTFRNFLADVFAVFMFAVWLWMLLTVFSDLFRRRDISGWAKAAWIIFTILTPYIGVLAYLIFQGRGMAERSIQQAQQIRDDYRRMAGFSVADEIEKLDHLRRSGSITPDEYARLRARLV